MSVFRNLSRSFLSLSFECKLNNALVFGKITPLKMFSRSITSPGLDLGLEFVSDLEIHSRSDKSPSTFAAVWSRLEQKHGRQNMYTLVLCFAVCSFLKALSKRNTLAQWVSQKVREN